MNIKIESIGCYQLKGEEVIMNDKVVFSGEYWPHFMSNTPANCPLRLGNDMLAADFVACGSCEHAIIKLALS